ncbi:hypothetical protein PAMA_002640 [Pampus argenteus]
MDPGENDPKLDEFSQRSCSELHRGAVNAAHDNTFTALDRQQHPVDPALNATASDTYVSLLHEYCVKKKISVKTVESISLEANTAFLKSCSFVVDGKKHPAAFGKTKKEAKEEAAKIAYQSLDVKSEDRKARRTNFIGIVHHYCNRTGRILNFIEVKRCGPPHNPQFFYKVMINDRDYPVAEGNNSRDAKQNAAQLAWTALQEQSDWDSKVSLRSTMSEDGAPTTLSSPTTMLESHKTPSQSLSELEMLTITSNPAQVSVRSAVSVDSAPTRLSAPSSLESLEASSQSMATGTSDSVIFTDSSSNPFSDKDPVKNKNMENRPSEGQSRFTSDFDSIKRIAKGGFGRVYKAREKLVDKYYAVKIVPSKQKALREVGALSELLHVNIVRYYNCWMEDSEYQCDSSTDSYSSSQSTSNSSSQYLYIKMELCDTKTLKDWINAKNKEALQNSRRREESLPIAQQIVGGVEWVHAKKLIHRDLKPANIMFGQSGEVKIGDFGLVAAEDDDGGDDDKKRTERTGKTGTKSYMAPEQKCKKMYDRKVDIFALGLIYFELLWRFSSGHERGVMLTDARSQKLPEEFSHNFPEENRIIMSMLCEKPEDRPEASTLKAELEKCTQIFNAQNNMHQENKTI